jgi:hypothetical protein
MSGPAGVRMLCEKFWRANCTVDTVDKGRSITVRHGSWKLENEVVSKKEGRHERTSQIFAGVLSKSNGEGQMSFGLIPHHFCQLSPINWFFRQSPTLSLQFLLHRPQGLQTREPPPVTCRTPKVVHRLRPKPIKRAQTSPTERQKASALFSLHRARPSLIVRGHHRTGTPPPSFTLLHSPSRPEQHSRAVQTSAATALPTLCANLPTVVSLLPPRSSP